MAESMLKHLLAAELRAEEKIGVASRQREHMIQQALDEARAREAEFDAGFEARRAVQLAAAEDRARQHVAELETQHHTRQQELRRLAGRNEAASVEAALELFLGDGKT
jgi:hypothetical protein